MMFVSKTPRDLNHDPQPYRNKYDGSRWIDPGVDWGNTVTFDPRPEFDHVQHNAPNPILLAYREHRESVAASGFNPVHEHLSEIREMLGTDGIYGDVHGRIFTYAELDHARLVLTRLAALPKESEKWCAA